MSEETSADEDTSSPDSVPNYRPKRDRRGPPCDGKFVIRVDLDSGRHYICCSRWNPKDPSTASHYILRNLHGFDLEYLQALFASKTEDIKKREEEAKKYGYGLLAPCQYVGEHRQTREFCIYWHRDASGNLRQGELSAAINCSCAFTSYVPYDLQSHPKTALITSGPHTHPPPR